MKTLNFIFAILKAILLVLFLTLVQVFYFPVIKSNSLSFVLYAITSFFLIMLGFIITKKSLFKECNFIKTDSDNIYLMVVVGASLSIFTAVFIQTVKIIPNSWIEKNAESTNSLNDGNVLFALLSALILAPIIEEIVYRGLIFKIFSKASNPAIAIVMSALFFGIAHWNPLQSSYAFLVGLVLAYSYYKTKSIWVPIFLHCSYNSAPIFTSSLLKNPSTLKGYILLSLSLLTTIIILISFSKKNKKEVSSLYPFNSRFILASASPRRVALLNEVGVDFTVLTSNAEKVSHDIAGNCVDIARELSKRKALDVNNRNIKKCKNSIIISADTIVTIDPAYTHYLGKPANKEDAAQMLRVLSGKIHYVITAITLFNTKTGLIDTRHETTKVYFDELSDEEIYNYVKTGDPMDKAGAYGIQSMASIFINKIDGDYYNVVGLPVNLLYRMLKDDQKL